MTLDGYPIVKKGSVLVLVSSSAAVPVTVTGSVKLGKGKLAHLVGGVQTILPGKIATFALQFPNKLRAKLKKLKRRKSLRLEVQASATDVIGRASSDTLQVRLKGQKWAGGSVLALTRLLAFSSSALGVVVGSGYGYRREDGVYVIPIGALDP